MRMRVSNAYVRKLHSLAREVAQHSKGARRPISAADCPKTLVFQTEMSLAFVMMPHDSEPLEPHTWFAQIERIAEGLSSLDGEAPDACIRRAFHIVNLAPAPLRDLIQPAPAEEVMERFLACGAYSSAALSLINDNMGLKITRDPKSRQIRAEISLPDGEATGTSEHDTVERTVLMAWAKCLLALRQAATGSTDRPIRRRFLYEPPRNSTEH